MFLVICLSYDDKKKKVICVDLCEKKLCWDVRFWMNVVLFKFWRVVMLRKGCCGVVGLDCR